MAKLVLEFEKPILELEQKIEEMRKYADNLDIAGEITTLEKKVDQLRKSIYSNLTRWQKVQLARHPDRPYTLDYIEGMTTDFVELHGDRFHGDDKAIVGGFANLNGETVMIVGHQKGRDTKSNLYRNFGMPNPEGYRKSRFWIHPERIRASKRRSVDKPRRLLGISLKCLTYRFPLSL
jgi:acetyl-CoA carboxylase carboxyl transferase subunit alpha